MKLIQLKKNQIGEEEIFDIAINSGAKDCISTKSFHEIITEKEDFYKIKIITIFMRLYNLQIILFVVIYLIHNF